MAHYAVGDLQGCYDPLRFLLDRVSFDPKKDTLICVGDLVNRGPKSLKTLRFLISLGDSCQTVLGNHDIHLLAMIYGVRDPKPHDSLQKVITAHDLPEITNWLQSKPLVIVDEQRKNIYSHAGIYPWWTKNQALDHAKEVEDALLNDTSCAKLLKTIYSNSPSRWSEGLSKKRRMRFAINAFTRMRFCSPSGHLNFTESGYKGKKRKNRSPWFDYSNPSVSNYRIVFGHWSALGFLNTSNHLCLDTGYVWGRDMTMVKLDNQSGPIPNLNIFTVTG